jgi:hypothetical protein
VSVPDTSLPQELQGAGSPPTDADWNAFDSTAVKLGVAGYVAFLKNQAIRNAQPGGVMGAASKVVNTLNTALPGWQVLADVLAPVIPFAPLLAALGGGLVYTVPAVVGGGLLPAASVTGGGLFAAPSSQALLELPGDTQNSLLGQVSSSLTQTVAPVVGTLQPIMFTLIDATVVAQEQGLTECQKLATIAGQIMAGFSLVLELGATVATAGGAAIPAMGAIEQLNGMLEQGVTAGIGAACGLASSPALDSTSGPMQEIQQGLSDLQAEIAKLEQEIAALGQTPSGGGYGGLLRGWALLLAFVAGRGAS